MFYIIRLVSNLFLPHLISKRCSNDDKSKKRFNKHLTGFFKNILSRKHVDKIQVSKNLLQLLILKAG